MDSARTRTGIENSEEFDVQIDDDDDDIEKRPKLDEEKLLEMIDTLQKENRKWMSLYEKNQQEIPNTSSPWSSVEHGELLDHVLGEKLSDHRDEIERQAILSHTTHRDFYLLLTRKLCCMINSCENLSTGMLSSGSRELIQSSTARMLRDKPSLIFKSVIGIFISTALTAVKETIPGVKIVAEPIQATFNLVSTLSNRRDQYMAVARVADFANLATIIQTGNSKGLQSTIEKFARLMIRARSSLSSFPFTEQQDKFGRVKQYMVNLFANPDDTPVKEQAAYAADCAFAHIMMPSNESILHNILNGVEFETSLAEALAATTLNIPIEQIRSLAPISNEGSSMMRNTDIDNLPTAGSNAIFTIQQPSDDDDDDDDALDLEGYSDDVSNIDHRMPSCSIDAEHLIDKIADLDHKIERLDKLQRSFNSKMKADASNSAGDGLVYADFREQYKDDVNMLKRQSVNSDERASLHSSEIAILKEQVQLLQKQLSESTAAPSPSEKGFNSKKWFSRRRDQKDP